MKLHLKDPQYLAKKDYYQKCFDNIKFNNDYAKYLVNKNKEINLNDSKNEKDENKDEKEIKSIEVKNEIEEKDNSKINIAELNNCNNLQNNELINNINNNSFLLNNFNNFNCINNNYFNNAFFNDNIFNNINFYNNNYAINGLNNNINMFNYDIYSIIIRNTLEKIGNYNLNLLLNMKRYNITDSNCI